MANCAVTAKNPPAAPLSFFPLRTVWTLALNNQVTAPPRFDGTRAYFPIEGDRLVAYDLITGKQLWLVSTAALSSPASGGGLVFVAEGEFIAARSAEDGTVRWRVPQSERLAAPLVWDNGWLIASDTSGMVLAFRASDGRLIWKHNIGAQAHAAPALAADRVYVPSSDGRLIALRVSTGDQLWEHRLGGAPNEVLPLDGRLYVGSTDNFFYCLNDAGTILWRWPTGADVVGLAAFDDRHVYFVSFDNVLRCLDRKSGAQIWKRPLPMRPTTGAILAGDVLIVSGLEPPLRAYFTKDGSSAADVAAPGTIAAPGHIVRDGALPLPIIVLLTRDIAAGDTAVAFARAIEPPATPLAPLPNPVNVTAPAGPPSAPGETRPPAPPKP